MTEMGSQTQKTNMVTKWDSKYWEGGGDKLGIWD